MAFKAQVAVTSKIIVHNTVLERVNTFTYMGHGVSYEEEKDITSKIGTFLQVLGIVDNVLKQNLAQKPYWLTVYNILPIPSIYTAVKFEQSNKGT
jgi:hypothetical protein